MFCFVFNTLKKKNNNHTVKNNSIILQKTKGSS
jgi:hypothetical protein